jgi:purine-binding chemotaxis protein CheW
MGGARRIRTLTPALRRTYLPTPNPVVMLPRLRGSPHQAGMVADSVATVAGPSASTEPQWVLFVCDGQPYGFPLARVTEIMTPRPVTRLPGAPPAVCGLVGVRGRVVTAIDLRALLGGRAAAPGAGDRLLLLDLGLRHVAVLVDDVLAIEPAALQATTGDTVAAVPAAALLGTGTADAGPFIAMDPAALLGRLLS